MPRKAEINSRMSQTSSDQTRFLASNSWGVSYLDLYKEVSQMLFESRMDVLVKVEQALYKDLDLDTEKDNQDIIKCYMSCHIQHNANDSVSWIQANGN